MEQVEGVGERFVIRIGATVARIQIDPLMPRCFDGEYRKVEVEQFPDLVIDRVTGGRLQILAIAHMSRHPGFWRERARNPSETDGWDSPGRGQSLAES